MTFESILFLESFILSLKYLVPTSKWRFDLDIWEVIFFSCARGNRIFFLVYLGIVQICPVYHSLDKRVWFTINCYQRQTHSVPHMDFLLYIPSLILSHLEISGIDLPKLIPSISMEIAIISFVLINSIFTCTSP